MMKKIGEEKTEKMIGGEEGIKSVGLTLSNTQSIRSFLSFAASEEALSLSSQPSIPYKSLRSIWFSSDPNTRPSLSLLLRGSSFLLSSPKPRQKSAELKGRLRKLEELVERREYAELVKDITPKARLHEPFSSYKDQIGFGLHVLVTMFSGYLLGYAAFRALFSRDPVMNACGGILGLILAMLVETFLFIIRTSDYDCNLSTSAPTNPASHQKKNQ